MRVKNSNFDKWDQERNEEILDKLKIKPFIVYIRKLSEQM
jgi:hypothetical protein